MHKLVIALALCGLIVAQSQGEPGAGNGNRGFGRNGQPGPGQGGQGLGNVDRAQMKQMMLEMFDADGDGQLNQAERQQLMQAMQERLGGQGGNGRKGAARNAAGQGNANRAQARQKLIDEFDADGDGQLSEAERQTVRQAMAQRRAAQGENGRNRARGNGGQGNFDPEQMMQRLLEKFDSDGDGQLSETERQTFRQSMQERAGERGAQGPNGAGPANRQGIGGQQGPRGGRNGAGPGRALIAGRN